VDSFAAIYKKRFFSTFFDKKGAADKWRRNSNHGHRRKVHRRPPGTTKPLVISPNFSDKKEGSFSENFPVKKSSPKKRKNSKQKSAF